MDLNDGTAELGVCTCIKIRFVVNIFILLYFHTMLNELSILSQDKAREGYKLFHSGQKLDKKWERV